MTSLHQLYQKQVEAWKEDFGEFSALTPQGESLWLNDEDTHRLLSSRHKDTIELIEAIIKEVEGMKEKPLEYDGSDVCTHYQENCSCSPSKEKCRKHNQRVAIKNKALSDIRECLTKEMELIKLRNED